MAREEVGGIYSSGQWTGGFLMAGGGGGAHVRIVDAVMAEA